MTLRAIPTLALRAIATLALLSAISVPLTAQTEKPRFGVIPAPRQAGGEVKWTAGRVEAERDEYAILQDGVTIDYQDVKLRATKITYNRKTSDVTAEGNVVVDQGPTRITASNAVYNLDTKTGTFFNATVTSQPEMHFSGDRIEKLDEDSYRLTNGVFTSCSLDEPAWSFRIGKADVNLDDYAYMRNVSFRARNIPILWMPRLVWPTKRDRARGFLIPRLQLAGEFGPRLEIGYFAPFGDSADATVTADVQAKGNLGAGLNLRYLPSQNVKIGDLYLYGVQLKQPFEDSGKDLGRFQWRYRYQHAQENLPGGFRGVIDIQDFSNLNFFRRYDNDSYLHTLSNVYSSAYLTKNRPRYSLNILADRRELLFFTSEQKFEQLPALQFRMYPQRIGGTPLYFSMESSASQLRTNSIGDETSAYVRTDFFPTLSMQLRTPPWFSIRPQISLRQTNYTARQDRDPITFENFISDEAVDRFYAQGQVEIVGPSLSRTVNRAVGGFTRFKHVIEPRFRYLYTSDVQNQEDLIRFDTVDSPFLPIVRDSIEYALVQRILGKEGTASGSAREVMSLSLRQTASLSKPFERGTSTFVGENKFTPLVATLRVNPYQSITVDANAIFGNVSHQIDQTSFSANLIGTGGNAGRYMSLTWFSTFKSPPTINIGSNQFRVSTGSTFWRDRLRADIDMSYDATQKRFIEQRYILGGTASCYGLSIGARRFLIYETAEPVADWNFDFSLSLKNVGTIGPRR
ncbi:MAG: LPS assembly protein LptD [Thermoanaerobaculia bacterium]